MKISNSYDVLGVLDGLGGVRGRKRLASGLTVLVVLSATVDSEVLHIVK